MWIWMEKASGYPTMSDLLRKKDDPEERFPQFVKNVLN